MIGDGAGAAVKAGHVMIQLDHMNLLESHGKKVTEYSGQPHKVGHIKLTKHHLTVF